MGRAASSQARGSSNNKELLWPKEADGFVKVPYVIDKSLTEDARKALDAAITQFEWNTCISLKPKEDGDEDYLKMTDSQFCLSYIGRITGPQEVSNPIGEAY